MELCECKHITKCDFHGCQNLAKYSFSTKGILRRDLSFCESCMRGMYEEIGKLQTPKALEGPFKLNKKLRREK